MVFPVAILRIRNLCRSVSHRFQKTIKARGVRTDGRHDWRVEDHLVMTPCIRNENKKKQHRVSSFLPQEVPSSETHN